MAESRDEPRSSRRPIRGAWLLHIRFDKQALEVIDQEFVDLIAPQSFSERPRLGEHSGAWFEVRDADDDVLAYRILSDPFQVRAEHHSPDGKIEVFEREVDEGDFELLVPAAPGAASVVFFSSPREPGRTFEAADEVARFELERQTDGRQEP